MTLDHLETPALILDRARLERNTAIKSDRAKELGVALRPHLKTCKSLDVAKILLADGWTGVSVSTIPEAKLFFEAGITDIRYAAPFAPDKVQLVAPWLKQGLRFEVMSDDPEHAAMLADEAEKAAIVLPVIVEIDVDQNRAGVSPTSPRFAALIDCIIQNPYLEFAGLYSYAGGTYGLPDKSDRQSLIERHRKTLTRTADVLRGSGVDVLSIGFGSSPALQDALSMEGLDEACAGVFPFQDLAQRGIGVCQYSDIAVTVLASVVQTNPETGRVFVNAGSLALAQDRSTAKQAEDQGYGLVCDADTCEPLGESDIIISSVSQEVGRLSKRDGSSVDLSLFPVGRRLRIMPNHVCMTVNTYPGYHVLEDGEISEFWPRIHGWTTPPANPASAAGKG